MSYRMHDLSNALRAVSRDLPSGREDARRIIVKLCTKNEADKYPWQVEFESGSIARTYGPYKTFHDYLKAWSNMTWKDFRDWFRDDDEVANLLDEAVKQKPGKRKKPDPDILYNVQDIIEAPTGNSKDATLRRLRKDRPDLLEKVKVGDLSANAAALEAGFRKPSRTIPIDTPENAIKALLRVFTAEELSAALRGE